MSEPVMKEPLRPETSSNRSMPLWKQIIGVVFALCVGGFAAALFATYGDLLLTPLALAATVPAALVFGLPGFFVFRRFRMLNFFWISLAGVVVGFLVMGWAQLGYPSIGLVGAVVSFVVIRVLGIPTTPSRTKTLSGRLKDVPGAGAV